MTAEGKEVIEDAHAFETEHTGKAFSERVFERRARCDIGGEILPLRIGQRTAIEFAVRCERQCIEHDERRGHHVIRQSRRKMFAQHACIDACRPGDISDKLLILRLLVPSTRDNHGLTHRRMTGDLRFDLTQLDTEPTNLDLMIVTAKKLDIAIGAIASDIARAIHTPTRNKRIIDKPFDGQLRPIQITSPHTRTADVQLAHRTDRHQPPLCIEQINARVGNRTADRHRIGFFLQASIGRCPHRRFRGAVLVIKRYGAWQRRALPREARRTRFARHDDLAKPMFTARRHAVENRLTERRHAEHACDVATADQFDDRVRISCRVDIDERKTAAGRERPEEAGDGAIEGEGRKQQEALVRGMFVELMPRACGCDERPMFDRNALGLASRTGGVDHVGEVMRCDGRLWVMVRKRIVERGIGIEHRQRSRVAEGFTAGSVGDQKYRRGIREDVTQAFAWIRRIERHVCATGFEYRHQRDDHANAALHAQRDAIFRPDAECDQMMRESIGAFVEPRIGERFVFEYECNGIGRFFDLLLE
ncbi:hypothetical protein AWB70_07560 [Caballeronia cordobensis]|uniref:Uncharacterized protein n=1 Tax=Caballeronia cordobensis TaxID=1353886 RepID=A0A158JW13_CABCO|nr:hypothetical protein AWB70_07560 [Caballeronia cordobensis]